MVEKMKRTICSALLALTLLSIGTAQDRLPQEYVAADEIISLSADMTFDEAFQILSAITYKKEGKTIIDPAKRQKRIDVQIVNLPWKKAFEIILKAHRLWYVEHEKFYEVTGEPEKMQPGEVIISLSTREVHIEAVFFEADRRALAESGVDWSFLRATNVWSAGVDIRGATGVSDEIVEGNFDYSKNIGEADYTVGGILRAFESQNLGRILAQPEVVVISGKQGRVQVGQDFSIKTRDFAGNIIDNFFSTGTILTVIPTVYSEDNIPFIHLVIEAERSSASPDVVSTTINKSHAITEVILIDGESTTVGGLFSREFQTVRKGVPILKDLPWWFFGLRYLFGQSLVETSDKELLVILKANILPELRTRSNYERALNPDKFELERSESIDEINKSWEQGVDKLDEGE
jgi:type IV pilus assembly protein PilQ